ncbi:SirB2 family protein [Flagellatimonas centrodinii]|uniref:SirB2 family protein n=1 Tax=Flagellatimonas centrodinii TaxID=2806210 RepID=UPI001FEEC730|nr:SirB2 family protein [Flagellatimonas centrodinii]ULQ47785.1 SirB2 family protein [Flagellatimonas centrodinii]
MIEFYAQIKLVHIGAVLISGSLFLVRGGLVMADRQVWALAAPMRYSSYAIDTILLTAALMLVSILPSAMFANGWLAMKLALLVPYVLAGTIALRRGRTPKVRWISYTLALASFAMMYSVARSHDPWGALRILL